MRLSEYAFLQWVKPLAYLSLAVLSVESSRVSASPRPLGPLGFLQLANATLTSRTKANDRDPAISMIYSCRGSFKIAKSAM